MDQCILNGNAVIEIDFLFTSDGELVCLHGWTDVGGLETACTLDEFKNLKIYGKYTPMTAEDALEKGAYGIYTDFLTEEDINSIMK